MTDYTALIAVIVGFWTAYQEIRHRVKLKISKLPKFNENKVSDEQMYKTAIEQINISLTKMKSLYHKK